MKYRIKVNVELFEVEVPDGIREDFVDDEIEARVEEWMQFPKYDFYAMKVARLEVIK